MPSAADRTGPNLAVIADATANATPYYPLVCCPSDGYVETSLSYTDVLTVVAEFPGETLIDNPDRGYYMRFGFCADPKIVITPFTLANYPSTWATIGDSISVTGEGTAIYSSGTRYIFEFTAPDKDNLTMSIWRANSYDDSKVEVVDTATLNVTDLFDGDFTLSIGFPTDAVLGADEVSSESEIAVQPFKTPQPYGMRIISITKS